jgi:hypothetical protein
MTLTQRRPEADAELIAELFDKTGIDLSALPSVMPGDVLAPAIGTTVGALAQDRYRNRGIPYITVGRRRIRYSRAQVARHLLANQRPYS